MSKTHANIVGVVFLVKPLSVQLLLHTTIIYCSCSTFLTIILAHAVCFDLHLYTIFFGYQHLYFIEASLRRTLPLKIILLNIFKTAQTFICLCAAFMHVGLYLKFYARFCEKEERCEATCFIE